MPRGNVAIDKENAKNVRNGKIVMELPWMMHKGELVHLFSVDVPETCSECGSKLYDNKSHDRFILTVAGTLKIPVTYKRCSECGNLECCEIVGVDGSRNYSEEFLSKSMLARDEAKTSLHNTGRAAEIFGGGIGVDPRAPCPTTLWRYEQKLGGISLEELRETDVSFNGTLHVDGYWVKCGWREFIEEARGGEFSDEEWKKFWRYKVIYVFATEDKVILDFVITDPKPPSSWLIPIFKRVKQRLGEENIERVVSDEDTAIIRAADAVLPNAVHGFCVFHQLKNLTKKFLEKFDTIDDLPTREATLYEKGQKLIKAKNVKEAAKRKKELEKVFNNSSARKSRRRFENKIQKFLKDKHRENKKHLKKGFVPSTNNVMEQIFSFISDFTYQAKSFKTKSGLKNWTANMFNNWNHREFNTGKHYGLSPLDIARKKGPPTKIKR
ncbi:hypothetical protein AKJ65_08285 [candidate division MSBL1 archaeon SCGC-AAA259E19]|uniref:MULE transposase domain-containing protein n=1 Tax=candidate division MSBL1 archaeon SCGC-AAA259E19 TaxID=1698264 RepID=A0A133UCI0_9EURY|nr:hypothetical protein AKJ65_08285 [candidate division MSBL1 archaeon SCGC-AAA259E19]